MPNWTEPMGQKFEYYVVDPYTWTDSKQLKNIKSCTITRDSSVETLGSATFNITGTIPECYIRVYLITEQEGVTERHPLGTFLVQSPSSTFDGKLESGSMAAYTPLIELKENPPPIGYSILKGGNIIDNAFAIIREKARAPVVRTICDKTLHYDFVANVNDTWITYLNDLIGNAEYKFDLDEIGRILFSPEQDIASLQPVWTYNDGNSSILCPSISINSDMYGIPNVVEVVYSNGSSYYECRVVNDNSNSPISTIARGREITHRITNPSLNGNPTESQIEEYANKVLRELSTLEHTVTYTHGYCPTRLNDCIRLDYADAGLENIKAKVISQTIKCATGCSVTEKAVFTNNLWR